MLLSIGLTGDLLATAVYLSVLCLLVTGRTGTHPAGRGFIAAVLADTLLCALRAAAASGVDIPDAALTGAETVRHSVWLLFLVQIVVPSTAAANWPGSDTRRVRNLFGIGILLLTLVALLAGLSPATAGLRTAAQALLLTLGLVYLLQIYAKASLTQRHAVKYLCLSMGALFSFDLGALLDHWLGAHLSGAWQVSRGYASLMVVPMLAVTAARNRAVWRVDVGIARKLVFDGAMLAIGLTAFAASLAAAQAVLGAGRAWSEVAALLTAFAGLVLAVLLVSSSRLRARLRVFLSKNFFRSRYDYRAQWLNLTQLLASEPANADSLSSSLEARAVAGLAEPVESPGGVMWLADESGVLRAAGHWQFDMPTPDIDAHDPLVTYLRERQWIIDLQQWRGNGQSYGELELPQWLARPHAHWLVIPLLAGHRLIGMVLLARPMAPSPFNWEMRDMLVASASQVAGFIAQRGAMEALAQARQFESFNRMSAFVVHDLKNLVAQLSLLVKNAARHQHNLEFQADMLGTVRNVLGRMQRLLRQLDLREAPTDPLAGVPVGELIDAAVATKLHDMAPVVDIDPLLRHAQIPAHRARLERVLGHLLQNAAESMPADGVIRVSAARDLDGVSINIEDSGCGMSEDFIEHRLFKPFETTKESGMGLGMFETREYIREIGGSIAVTSSTSVGSVFTVRLPLLPDDTQQLPLVVNSRHQLSSL